MSGTLVALGIGNTSCKAGVIRIPTAWPPTWSTYFEGATHDFDLAPVLDELPDEEVTWCVASVHRPCQQRLEAVVREHRPHDRYWILSHEDLPLKVDVAHPERVGMDRLVAAVSAQYRYPDERPCIIVDAGTALTVDLLQGGAFRGGAILPGWKMATVAMASGTDLLPEVDVSMTSQPQVIGRSTTEAIRSGIFWGTVGGIRELVGRMRHDFPDARVVLTGGDACRFAPIVDAEAEHIEDLVLAGVVGVANGVSKTDG